MELVGGPLDGQLLDVTALALEERTTGALLIAPRSAYGPGGRADYEPSAGGDPGRWNWIGDVP
ncbi:hypothetical protein [Streptomyces cyaneofuscatus]|uniref:hypothetical protein n=1 Tax=Streptomyces cyaneofuscatus TaxID=66883 RepID=UPI0037F2F004